MNQEIQKHLITKEQKLELYIPGEWIDEPDFVEFYYRNYKCFILRNKKLGFLCGYIVIKKNHPWFGKDDQDIECKVYNGLTYSSQLEKDPVVGSGFFIGFDCGDFYDFIPAIDFSNEFKLRTLNEIGELSGSDIITYKNIDFVKKELKNLVDQAIETNSKPLNLA